MNTTPHDAAAWVAGMLNTCGIWWERPTPRGRAICPPSGASSRLAPARAALIGPSCPSSRWPSSYVGRPRQRTGHGRKAPACATRSFLRFLAWRGAAPSGLDRAIPSVRRAHHASLPPHLSSEQLARLLERPAVPCSAEYRDRAILLLMARLGLRAGEVAALEFSDLDWQAGQLRLRAGRCRRERVLPLPQEVGAALVEYLRHGRPAGTERRLFLALTDPLRAFHPAAVTKIVQRNLKRAGIPLGRLTGAHMLRHTAASRMVNRGASFKDVADVLGHRSLQTTGIYAKLDLHTLAGVALPWIGGGAQ